MAEAARARVVQVHPAFGTLDGDSAHGDVRVARLRTHTHSESSQTTWWHTVGYVRDRYWPLSLNKTEREETLLSKKSHLKGKH